MVSSYFVINNIELNKVPGIETMMSVRSKFAYGYQRDYFDDANRVGWIREGEIDQSGSGCAVLISNGRSGLKKMSMGEGNAYKKMRAVYGDLEAVVGLDEKGDGTFFVNEIERRSLHVFSILILYYFSM